MACFLQAHRRDQRGPRHPPPPEQSVANCTNSTYASDFFVCADPELLGLDRQVRDVLAGLSFAGARRAEVARRGSAGVVQETQPVRVLGQAGRLPEGGIF